MLGGTEHVRVASKLVHSPVATAAPRAKGSSACSGRNQSGSCNRAGGKVNESDLAQNMLRTALAFMKEAQRATCRRGCVNVWFVGARVVGRAGQGRVGSTWTSCRGFAALVACTRAGSQRCFGLRMLSLCLLVVGDGAELLDVGVRS